MQEQLGIKRVELEEKQKEAEIKLKQMVEDQNIAEVQKKEAMEIKKQVEEQTAYIAEQKEIAHADLDKAEPALIEAKRAVKGINPRQLQTIRSYANPPVLIQLTLEAVFKLLGHRNVDWSQLRKNIMDKNFIPSIVKFKAQNIHPKIREHVRQKYLSNAEFNFEAVNRASTACGPLFKWLESQINYADILHRVAPLKQKVKDLEEKAEVATQKLEQLTKSVSELEEKISQLKSEYAVIIAQSESIRSEMEVVQTKVDRSISLLENLSSEKGRWTESLKNFDVEMSTVIGDSLLSAAFLAYTGFFDQHYRDMLMQKWIDYLNLLGIKHKQNLSVIEYLSHPDERLFWHSKELPEDTIAEENAIMLKRFNRYPLVIDPSGQATKFLMNLYSDKNIKKTSFLDKAFMKHLESALRFGTPLLVEDVESIDPVLNPVLNKEIRKTGGRVLITLGDQDVDFSPSFVIFLATRDPTAHFTPDLCSRVTFVNFTVTPNSLQSQCLYSILKCEEKEMHEKQIALLQLQGKYKVMLRQLEQSLLDAINDSQDLLHNNTVVQKLENLKNQAADIELKTQENERVMNDIKEQGQFYSPMATICSAIYFTLEQMGQIYFLYQFSLNFFLDIFNSILYNNPHLETIREKNQRLQVLIEDLFRSIYIRISRSLLQRDRLSFAMRLAQLKLKLEGNLNDELFSFILRGGDTEIDEIHSDPSIDYIPEESRKILTEFVNVNPSYQEIWENFSNNNNSWTTFLKSEQAEMDIPDSIYTQSPQNITSWLEKLVLLKSLRLDRFIAGTHKFIQRVFDDELMKDRDYNLAQVVEIEATPKSPLILCCATGYDASTNVDELAAQKGIRNYKSIALGSPEGFEAAEIAINDGLKFGYWVLLKNIHLAPRWLVQLEKKIYSSEAHPQFRLFMTTEINPNLPTSLLRVGHVFVYESPPGIKANLLRTFSNIPREKLEEEPIERGRLYFLLAWFHAVVQERLRYTPTGWTKGFEFSETDKRGSFDTLDYWITSVSKGKSNVDPSQIPWDAIRTLLGQAIYGGRIDNPFDQRVLDSFLHQLFTSDSYSNSFKLVHNQNVDITIPDCQNFESVSNWINSLPESQTPAWLGLPNNAELILLREQAKHAISTLLKMQTVEDAELGETENKDQTTNASERPSWMLYVESISKKWLSILPEDLPLIEPSPSQGPLYRCLARELSLTSSLLKTIRTNLSDLILTCNGELKQTNQLRSLINDITKGIIPQMWKKYKVMDTSTLSTWLPDFLNRTKQISRIYEKLRENNLSDLKIWIGGLFNTEAFITATRQSAARANNWSLENLVLTIVKNPESDKKNNYFTIEKLSIHAADFEYPNILIETSEMVNPIESLTVCWKLKEEVEEDGITIPVYLNNQRSDLLFPLNCKTKGELSENNWYQRGTAFIANKV